MGIDPELTEQIKSFGLAMLVLLFFLVFIVGLISAGTWTPFRK